MKKLKILPAILMLVLCFGVLAIGIYAIQPSQNTISGTITVNASNAEVKLELFIGDSETPAKTYESVRGGADFTDLSFEFNTENANVLSDVDEIMYTIRITNLSSKSLGAYFFKPGTEDKLNEDMSSNIQKLGKGYAKAENIMAYDEIETDEETPRKMADVYLSDYSHVPANDEVSTDMTIIFSLAQFFEATEDATSFSKKFNYVLNIEPYESNVVIDENFEMSSDYKFIKLPEKDSNGDQLTTAPSSIAGWSVQHIAIPYGYTSLGDIYYNPYESVAIPKSVTNIPNLHACYPLKHLIVPSSVTTFGYGGAFTECDQLKYVRFLGDVKNTTIDLHGVPATAIVRTFSNGEGYAFKNGVLKINDVEAMNTKSYDSFKQLITTAIIAEGITTIPDSAFSGYTHLTNVSIPNSCTLICDSAFLASGLKSVTIPYGVISIEEAAFEGCPGLSRVSIPSTVTTIVGRAIEADEIIVKAGVPTEFDLELTDDYVLNGTTQCEYGDRVKRVADRDNIYIAGTLSN